MQQEKVEMQALIGKLEAEKSALVEQLNSQEGKETDAENASTTQGTISLHTLKNNISFVVNIHLKEVKNKDQILQVKWKVWRKKM